MGAHSNAGRTMRWGALAVGPFVALGLSVWHLDAGLISDDGAILGWVHQQPPLADLGGPQYGLSSIRFWRPLTTLSFDLQEAWTGVAPFPLRAFNALAHALAALGAAALLGAVGARPWAMALAGLWVATFPHQGGTTGWPAGRVDALCLPLVLGALWASFRGRPGTGALLAALAVGTKEMGWVVAPAALFLGLARGGGVWPALVRAAPLGAVVALAIALRPLLLGTWVGGYPGPGPDPGDVVAGAARGLVQGLGWSSGLALSAGCLLLCLRRGAGAGPLAAGAAAGFVATFLLAHLVAGGPIPPEHLRTLLVPDALVGVGLAWALARAVGVPPSGAGSRGAAVRIALLGLVAVGLVWRAELARRDLGRWAAAGDQAERELAEVRRDADALEPGGGPLLFPSPSRLDTTGRAYVLHFGAAERLRPPFVPTPRELWPWRPVFPGAPEREWLGARRGALLDPFGAPDEVASLPLLVVGDGGSGPLRLAPADLSGAPAKGPRVGFDGGSLEEGGVVGAELLLATDQGYGAVPVDGSLLVQLASPSGLSLVDLLRPVGPVLLHAVEFGAQGALVELRILGAGAELLLRVGPLELRLEPDLVRWLRGS